MRLDQLMTHEDWAEILHRFSEPAKGPRHPKGEDAIMVHGYVVQGHWRRRAKRNGRVSKAK